MLNVGELLRLTPNLLYIINFLFILYLIFTEVGCCVCVGGFAYNAVHHILTVNNYLIPVAVSKIKREHLV